jgi:hypothetical protein
MNFKGFWGFFVIFGNISEIFGFVLVLWEKVAEFGLVWSGQQWKNWDFSGFLRVFRFFDNIWRLSGFLRIFMILWFLYMYYQKFMEFLSYWVGQRNIKKTMFFLQQFVPVSTSRLKQNYIQAYSCKKTIQISLHPL